MSADPAPVRLSVTVAHGPVRVNGTRAETVLMATATYDGATKTAHGLATYRDREYRSEGYAGDETMARFGALQEALGAALAGEFSETEAAG